MLTEEKVVFSIGLLNWVQTGFKRLANNYSTLYHYHVQKGGWDCRALMVFVFNLYQEADFILLVYK